MKYIITQNNNKIAKNETHLSYSVWLYYWPPNNPNWYYIYIYIYIRQNF